MSTHHRFPPNPGWPLFSLFVAGFLLTTITSCTPPVPPMPPHVPYSPPMPREVYQYSWTLPEQAAAGSTGLTICVVRPDFNEKSSVTAQTYASFSDGFSASLATDLDKLLVAKGVKVIGPFQTYDDITYSEKKMAHLALTPTVFLTIATPRFGAPVQIGNHGVTDYIERKFEATVQGFVEFVMIETLSRQKIWVKKLELEPLQISGVQAFEAIRITDPTTGALQQINVGKPIYSGMQEAIGDAMMSWYPVIAQKAWVYLDTAEMASFLPVVEEIRTNSGSIIH